MSRLEAKKKLASVRQLVLTGYDQGATLRELSKIYEVAPGTVRNFLISNGVNLRSRGRRSKEPVQPEAVQTETNVEQENNNVNQ